MVTNKNKKTHECKLHSSLQYNITLEPRDSLTDVLSAWLIGSTWNLYHLLSVPMVSNKRLSNENMNVNHSSQFYPD